MALRTQPGGAGVTPHDVWNYLISLGATPVQAAGIMGNMQAESGINPDGPAGDKGTSFGLFQQHGSYSYLVTGNPVADMVAQVKTMIANGGMTSATGSTPAEVARNFAHGYERCAACGYQDGSAELDVRAANATAIYNAATSGNWGAINYSAGAGVGPGGAPTGAGSNTPGGGGCHSHDKGSNCLISIPLGPCLTRCELKGLLGGLAMVAGGVLVLAGVLVVARGAIQKAAASTVTKLGPAGVAAGVAASSMAGRQQAGLGAARSRPSLPRGVSRPGPAARPPRRPSRAGARVETEGSEAYDAGYQRAMLDLESRSRELEEAF